MLGRHKRAKKPDAELDITSFMNLMIVLVPVLLMMMVFSRITVLELQLPENLSSASPAELEAEQLELLVDEQGIRIYYPATYLVAEIPKVDGHYDMPAVQQHLQDIKQGLLNKGVDKQGLVLLLADSVDYQSIVALMDVSRSYKDVVAASVVDAELFPEIALADAPRADLAMNAKASGDAR